jgi:hypothetical protein
MTARPLLIGLTGRAGAGKSTVAGYLENRWAWAQVALADPIVDMISALFDSADVPSGFMTERQLKEQATPLGYSYRHLAQTLGTEWGRRTLHADFWTTIASRKVQQWQRQGDDVVVSDLRFSNEAAMVEALGGVVVRIERQGLQPLAGATGAHESERQALAIPCHHVLHNPASDDWAAVLESQVDALVERLRDGVRPLLMQP